MIYFLKDNGNQAIKIGYAAKPEERRPDLQTGNPNRLVFIGFIPGDRAVEHGLHKMFEKYLVQNSDNKEWFAGGPEFHDAIQKIISEGEYDVLGDELSGIFDGLASASVGVTKLREKVGNFQHEFAAALKKIEQAFEILNSVGTIKNPLIPKELGKDQQP